MVLGNFILPQWKSLWIPFFRCPASFYNRPNSFKDGNNRLKHFPPRGYFPIPPIFNRAQAANPLLAPLTFSTPLCKVRYQKMAGFAERWCFSCRKTALFNTRKAYSIRYNIHGNIHPVLPWELMNVKRENGWKRSGTGMGIPVFRHMDQREGHPSGDPLSCPYSQIPEKWRQRGFWRSIRETARPQ